MDAITAHGLTKKYKLYDKPFNRLKEIIFRNSFHREHLALNGITFSVAKGETLGIIGENGAGKSTLLKILSGTLSPTQGRFEVHGKVSSLLELGSGLHPEFTGLDNIYFYGSLRGLDRTFMETKLTEIIEFSELGDFIQYPVKTYSSGMFVRLAFSVATSVDPDTLILDEVLSVGDLHFQKKSADRILSFKEKGKTIVFCSHELYHVARLCDRVLWLKDGRVHMEGEPFVVIQEYETYQMAKGAPAKKDLLENDSVSREMSHESSQPQNFLPSATEKPLIFIKHVYVSPQKDLNPGDDLSITVQVAVNDDKIPYRVAIKMRTVDGLDLIGIGTNKMSPFYGNQIIKLLFPKIQLRAGTFIIESFVFDEEGVYWFDRKEAIPIRITRDSIEVGILTLPHQWIID